MSASTVVPFEDTIQRVRDGSQDAAWELIQQFGPQIQRVVRRRLPSALRAKFDSEDFVQQAWASVFTHRSRLSRFTRSEEFVAFIGAVASNKVRMEIRRRMQGQKYNLRRERQFDESVANEDRPLENQRQPTPSQIAVARERWFRMLDGQPSHYQQIIELRFAGETYQEIANRLGFNESTVRRAIRRIFRDQMS